MAITTVTLARNEVRMLWNQFKRTIRTPSMLMFYGITIVGVYFVSLIVTTVLSFGPVVITLGVLIEEVLDRGTLFTGLGVVALSSIIGGYFGLGPATVLDENDEAIILGAPVKPYQLFLSRYIRRVVRKIVFVFAGFIAILPIVTSANLLFLPLVTLLISTILFFEVNYFLGGIASYFKVKMQNKTSHPIRHVLIVFLSMLAFLPTLPTITDNYVASMVVPSNAVGYIVTEVTGVFSWGYGPIIGMIYLALGFLISLLFLTALCDYDFYEVFASAVGREKVEGRFSRIVKGQVDFTETRFSDPMSWIMLKDFWSRMRTPLQIWKYVYVIFGTIFVLYLNIFRPAGFAPLQIPPALSSTAIPAFLLIVLLMIQLSSVTSLLSFVDEQDNIYLLKASPFKPLDIILAKYLLSLVEVALASIPVLGFIAYFFRVQGFIALLTLAAPLILLFTATGIAIGAFVPVFTNDPKILPVPLAFSFPIVNLTLGAVMIGIVAALAHQELILFILPLYILTIVFLFLQAGVRAMDSFR
ncbi:MAG: ABC transporter permease [Candidatus Thorarchaeota archaeon]